MSTTETDPAVEQVETPEEPQETPDGLEAPDTADDEQPEAEAPENVVEDQQPPGPSPEEIERTIGKIKTSANTFRRRVTELLGDEAQNLVPCELCEPDIPGFHWPAELIQPRDELHAHLLDVLRTPDAPDYSAMPGVRRCEICDGWGVGLSGSRVPGKGVVKCARCKGRGFVGEAETPADAPSPNGEVEVEFPDDAGPLVTEDTDVWGSPRILDDGQENPNYGKMPQYKDKSLP